MRKHIFGAALFSLIVSGFVLAFTFFYAPSIPLKENVKPPISTTKEIQENYPDEQINANKISYEVQSSQFFLDENKLVSKIKITWDGGTNAPEKVYLTSDFFTVDNGIKYLSVDDRQILVNPFKESNENVVTIVSDVLSNKDIDEKKNLYFFFTASQFLPMGKAQRSSVGAHQILFVHGNSSVIRNSIQKS